MLLVVIRHARWMITALLILMEIDVPYQESPAAFLTRPCTFVSIEKHLDRHVGKGCFS